MGDRLAGLCLAAVLLLAGGCLERTDKVTLNPDGSGKWQIDLYMQAPMNKNAPAADVTAMLLGILKRTKGVEAWSDVSLVIEPDLRPHFKGTVYFKDVSAFRFSDAGDIHVDWAPTGDRGRTLTVESIAVTGSGNVGANAQMSDERVKELMRVMRESWEHNREATAKMYAGFNARVTFVLPGKVTGSHIAKETASGVEVAVDEKMLMANLDKFMADDAALRDSLLRPNDPTLAHRRYLGEAGAITATVTGELRQVFDYRAEATAARRDEPGMFQKLGLAIQHTTAAPGLEGPIAPVEVK